MEPEVSVPIVPAAKLVAALIAEPFDEPPADFDTSYGWCVPPPTVDPFSPVDVRTPAYCEVPAARSLGTLLSGTSSPAYGCAAGADGADPHDAKGRGVSSARQMMQRRVVNMRSGPATFDRLSATKRTKPIGFVNFVVGV